MAVPSSSPSPSSQFQLIQWNCRGFGNRQKRSHLLLFLQSRGSLPAVLALQEAGLNLSLYSYCSYSGGPTTNGYSAWATHALSTQRSHTRVIQTTQAAPAVDPHLLHLWDARRGLLHTWRRHKLNRKLKARIAALTEEAAAYAAHLNDTNWVETCTKAAGQMGSRWTWRLFRSLLDPSSTRGETQRQLRRALHGFPGTSAQLADKLRDRYLCRTVDVVEPEYHESAVSRPEPITPGRKAQEAAVGAVADIGFQLTLTVPFTSGRNDVGSSSSKGAETAASRKELSRPEQNTQVTATCKNMGCKRGILDAVSSPDIYIFYNNILYW
ncbi:hypothetical protein HPB49_016620 [Dermacentor silvarum]|uniref:Uncharacterized protein n=1 Tax=Dermacentor silvarum TaxID=543639 RepID=A0ACB8CLR0_DERSI|nr:hypothetical protein HPB49_016620 [Dermacentor silvarum]